MQNLPPEAWVFLNTAINTFGALGTALIGYLIIIQNRKIKENADASKENRKVLEEVRENVNGNLTKAVHRAEDEARRTSAPRVLIVDDNRNDIELAAIKLRPFGCIIFTARDADEAEKLLMSNIGPGRGYPFDFVLLDLRMPAGNTERVFRMFNQKSPRVPLVVLTGDPGPGDGYDPSNTPRIRINKPLTELHVKSLLDQFSVPYRDPYETSDAALI